MTTSGTVGTTVIDVDTLINHAVRRAGKQTGDITYEIGLAARNLLFFYLSNLANHGVQLWTISREVYGLNAGKYQLTLPVGTEGVLNANKRTIVPLTGTAASSAGGTAANAFDLDVTTACIQTVANGNISLTVATSSSVSSVGIMSYGAQTLTPVIEYSTDGTTWLTAYTPTPDAGQTTIAISDYGWKWWDLTNIPTGTDFRIRETGGATLAVREIVFGNTPAEVPMSRLNRDDYNNLPNKTSTGTPLQYYFDRQISQPIMNLWPTPSSSFEQVVIYRHRQIQDVGSLTNTIEVPQRWQPAIMKNLAANLAWELPGVDPQRIQLLRVEADQATYEVEAEERDPSPIYLYPNIAVYTR